MTPKSIIGAVIAIALLVAWPNDAHAADWWGQKLANTPTQFIFGYGSLINTASRNSTAGTPTVAIPARISVAFGYVRSWNERSPYGFTALGLRKPHPGESAGTINGVIYPVESNDLAKFDARESRYTRVEVPHENIEPVGWQRLPERGQIWIYVPTRGGTAGDQELPEPNAAFPLLESYIDVVVEGALEYGPDFARELLETTAGWSKYWLNDRELARRPWVHDTRAVAVDRLLATVAPASAFFPERAYGEKYAARWLLEKAQ
jgi:hypothetical protein